MTVTTNERCSSALIDLPYVYAWQAGIGKGTDCQGVEQQQLEMLLKAWALQHLSGMRLPNRMGLHAAAHQMGASGTATRWPASAPTWAKSDFSSAEKGLTTMQSTH